MPARPAPASPRPPRGAAPARASASGASALLLLALVLQACTPATPAEDPGGCRRDADCAAGEICMGGSCSSPDDPCPPLTSCSGGCKDLERDPENCGGCGSSCGEAGCAGGVCCPPEAAGACNGSCVDLLSDSLNCGACGVECEPGLACGGGACCPPGSTICGDGCRELALDPGACGSCDNRCAAGAPCVDGVCGSCPAGTTEVDCGALRACLPEGGPLDLPCRLVVPSGPFGMGGEPSPPDDVNPDVVPAHEVTLTRAYALDLTEVTQGEYGACVDAGVCAPVEGLDPARKASYPVDYASWEAAGIFCGFRGGRLPTEAEWEKAARGPDGRLYPWGPERSTCGNVSCSTELQPVGRYPLGAGPYGQLDLLGNAFEWVQDFYAADTYQAGQDVDPTGPLTGGDRVYRSPERNRAYNTVTRRWRGAEAFYRMALGIRCAYDVP